MPSKDYTNLETKLYDILYGGDELDELSAIFYRFSRFIPAFCGLSSTLSAQFKRTSAAARIDRLPHSSQHPKFEA